VPRPDYIANLHAAKYDLRFCAGSEKREMLWRYKAALIEASRISGFTGPELEAAVARDFGAWVKQERLPKPPPQKQ
jgi:hypothetical protein